MILVRDNGIGIDAALLPRIFDLFAQGARALDRAQGGLGVGLTLVRRLVELHGGGVEAISAGLREGLGVRRRGCPASAWCAAASTVRRAAAGTAGAEHAAS